MATARPETLTSAAFALCRSVVQSPLRAALNELLTDLSVSQYGDGRPGRGHFGYLARHAGDQLAGYLLLDDNRSSINQGVGPVPQLSQQERALLESAHRAFSDLNEACVAGLAPILSGIDRVLNPYGVMVIRQSSSADAASQQGAHLLAPALVERVVRAFTASSMYDAVRRLPPTVASLSTEQWAAEIEQLDRLLRKAGVGGNARQFTDVAFQRPNHPARILLGFHAALVGIRASLRVLNQMLFQALQMDRVPTFNEDNVVAIEGPSTSIPECLIRISAIPSLGFLFIRPAMVVLLKHPSVPPSFPALGEVIATHNEFSQASGSLEHLTLHMVDEDLNPSPLFRSLAADA